MPFIVDVTGSHVSDNLTVIILMYLFYQRITFMATPPQRLM